MEEAMKVEEVLVEESYYERKGSNGSGSRCRMKTGRKSMRGAGNRHGVESMLEDSDFDLWEERGGWGDWDGWDDWDDEVDALGSPDEDDGEEDDDCGESPDGYDDDITELLEQERVVNRKVLGERGEKAAARYLKLRGYEILERNWKCPAGEADIIARDGSTLVFIEVKTRTGVSKGFPSEAVDAKKRARYEKIAGWYIMTCDELDVPVRFDVIALLVAAPDRAFMKHYVDAFGVGC